MNMVDWTIRTCDTGGYIQVRSVLHCHCCITIYRHAITLYSFDFYTGCSIAQRLCCESGFAVHVFLKGINHLWLNSSSLMGSSLWRMGASTRTQKNASSQKQLVSVALTHRSIFKYVHISSDVACSVALESTHVGMLCESSTHLIKKYCSKKAELFNIIQLFLYSTKS